MFDEATVQGSNTGSNNVELQLYFATVFNIKLFEIFHYWNMVHCLQ